MKHDIHDLEQMNARFYSSPPARYFSMRLGLLLQVAASTERYREELAAGIECGPLRLQLDPPGPVQFTPEDVERYVATETVMLHHHFAECLLRLYLAHLVERGCPWLGVGMLRNFKDFKDSAHGIAMSEPLVNVDLVARIFLGSATPNDEIEIDPAVWSASAEVHRSLLIEFARHCLEGANLYNAAKHGLAISGVSGPLKFGRAGEDPAFLVEGLWVEYLERKPTTHSEPATWQRTLEIVNTQRSWLLILAGLYMLIGLWASGEVANTDSKTLRLFLDARLIDVSQLLSFGAQSGPQIISTSVGVEIRPEP